MKKYKVVAVICVILALIHYVYGVVNSVVYEGLGMIIGVPLGTMFLFLAFICIARGKQDSQVVPNHTDEQDRKCTYCESNKIVCQIPVVEPIWGTRVGPKYTKGTFKILRTAVTYYDFCEECGTVLRTYVEIPEKAEWIHDKGRYASK